MKSPAFLLETTGILRVACDLAARSSSSTWSPRREKDHELLLELLELAIARLRELEGELARAETSSGSTGGAPPGYAPASSSAATSPAKRLRFGEPEREL
jgi:hypothetical protein